MKNRQANGFTLVELLVVVAIISILAALLLPALNRSIDSARTITCASKLKQIHLALTLYASDHKNWVPVHIGANGTNYSVHVWKHLLGEYAGLTTDLDWAYLPGGKHNLPRWRDGKLSGLAGWEIANGLNYSYSRGRNSRVALYNCPAQPHDDSRYGINGHVLNKKVTKLHGSQIFVADGGETWNPYFYWGKQVRNVHLDRANFSHIDGSVKTTGDVYWNAFKHSSSGGTLNYMPWIAP